MIAAQPRVRTCRQCKTQFQQAASRKLVCSDDCEYKFVMARVAAAAVKRERALIKVRKEALRDRSWYEKKLEGICNHIARLRDADDPCISCERHHQGQYHGGHFLSVGAHPRLRFDLRNINKQCQPCNVALSGNHHFYRIGMLKKYGCETVRELECHEATDSYQKPTIDDLKELIVERGVMLRQLLKAQA